MPHVIVNLWPGKSEQQKRRLAQGIMKDVMNVLDYGDESVSVALEEVDAADWAPKVYQPDIVDQSALHFELSRDQIAAIDALDTGVRGGPDPATVTLEGYGKEIPEA